MGIGIGQESLRRTRPQVLRFDRDSPLKKPPRLVLLVELRECGTLFHECPSSEIRCSGRKQGLGLTRNDHTRLLYSTKSSQHEGIHASRGSLRFACGPSGSGMLCGVQLRVCRTNLADPGQHGRGILMNNDAPECVSPTPAIEGGADLDCDAISICVASLVVVNVD